MRKGQLTEKGIEFNRWYAEFTKNEGREPFLREIQERYGIVISSASERRQKARNLVGRCLACGKKVAYNEPPKEDKEKDENLLSRHK